MIYYIAYSLQQCLGTSKAIKIQYTCGSIYSVSVHILEESSLLREAAAFQFLHSMDILSHLREAIPKPWIINGDTKYTLLPFFPAQAKPVHDTSSTAGPTVTLTCFRFPRWGPVYSDKPANGIELPGAKTVKSSFPELLCAGHAPCYQMD